MKKIYFLLVFFTLFLTNGVFGQGSTCPTMLPFCANNEGLIFPNTTGVPSIGAVGCNGSTPNPAWFYLQIDDPGNLNFNLVQNTAFDAAGNPIGTGLDVDFIAWGPFTGSLQPDDINTTLSTICGQLNMTCPPPSGTTCPSNPFAPVGTYPVAGTNIIDCSYSGMAVENFVIPNAQSGEIYVVLITNFNGGAGFIKLQQTGGTGSTSCDIVCPLWIGDDFVLCENESATLTASIAGASSYAWMLNGTTPVGNTQSITVNQPGTYSVLVNKAGCISNMTASINISPAPAFVVIEPDDITECDANGGSVTFDLSINDDIVDQSIYYTSYHLTEQDALDNISIGSTYTMTPPQTTQTIWVGIRSFDSQCVETRSFTLTMIDCGATPQTPADITLCENAPGSGQATFDFAALNNFVTNNQPGYTVTYHHNQTDADNDANAISPDNAYLGTNGEQIWVRMEDTADPTIDGVTSFHIYVLPLPTATISTSTPSVCLNTTGTVTFNGTPNATVTYNDGTANGTILLDAAGTATLTTPALTATAIYSLVDVATLGTPNCSQPQVGTATITVLPLPTATISGTTDVCQNAGAPNITFTGANGASPYTFTYTINNGTPQTVTTLAGNNTVTVAVPTAAVGGFVYDLVSVSSATTPSCSQSQTGSATVNVLALPTVAISTATPTICYNTTGSVTFTGTPNATVTYNDGTANQTAVLDATGSVTVVTPVLTADATYTLVDITSAGVPSCSQPQVGTATITVIALPTATISTTTATICSNTTGTVTFNGTPNATVTYNDGTANGTILLDATGTATLTTPALTATAIYTLVDVATLGTPNCSQPQVGTATITVLPLPTATISGTTDVCQNAGAPNITFTGANGASPYTFTYTINNGAPQTVTTLAGNNTVTVAVPTAAVGGFVYDLVSVSSATTPSCSQSQTGSATVNVLALPTVAISTATPTICYNTTGSVTFTGTPNATVTYNDGTANQTAVLDATGSVTVVTPVLTADAAYTLVDITSAGVPSCSQPQVGTATITVIALPTATISTTTATICSNTTGTVTFNGTPNATVTYNDGTANGTILLDAAGTATLTTPALTATAIYSLVDVATLGTPNCSQPQVGTATITVLPLPTATISGTTDVCQNAGAPNITFTGANGASPYTFTYTINNGAPQTVTTLAGNNTVTVAVPTAAVGGFVYDLVSVSSATTPSCSQSQTGSATVNVLALPTVAISTATPTICYNTTGSVTFTGTPNATVTYNDGTANQTAVLDATGSVTVVTPVLTADATYTLVDITSAGVPSCSQPQVGTATITVIALPTATISGTTTICEGNTAVVTFNGTPNATVTYTVDTGADQTITLDGAGVATLTTPTLNASSVYTLVSVASATTPSCSQPQTGSASITVLPAPTVAISVTNATICNATTTGVIFTGTANATVSYSVNGNPAQTVVIGALGTTTINTGALTVDTTYTLIDITSAGTPSCTQAVNGSVTITVVPVPGVTALVTSASYCSGQAIGVQLSDPTPTNTTTTFSWTVAAVTGGVTGASAGNGPIISQVLTAGTVQGTVTYTVTPHIGSCTGPSQNVTVTVNPTPVLSVNPATLTQNVCSGNATSITLSSNIPGTVYYWTVNQSGATGASIANADTTGVINQTLTATGNQIGQVVYVITPYYNGCPGTPKTVTVTVNPEPTATFNATSQDLCSGETTDIELNSNVAGTTFTWTVLQTNVLGAAPGSGDTIAQTLTTVGFTAGTVTYTITPSVNGCPGDVITVTVNVNPRPDVIGSSGIPFCSGEPTNIILSSAFAGVEYHWTVVQNGVAGASDGSNTTGEIQQILTTTGDTNGTAVYTITPRLGNCDGASLTITVTVLALPNPKIEDGIVCVDSISGAVVNPYILDTELNPADYNFTWYEGSGATAVLIPGETGSTYTAIEAGVYTVHVVNQNTGCDFEKTVTVTETNPAQSATAVVSNYFAETQAITVTVIGGTGPFVYSLDGGEFQSSNVFPYVLPGEHTVVVQDEAHTGCTDITIYPIVTVSYPNFFTPNGDGINDTWNIWSLRNIDQAAEIHVYDRYGKLIKQLTPMGNGWDGTFNGQLLPSTDYWFTVKFDENGTGRIFKSHFSMKR